MTKWNIYIGLNDKDTKVQKIHTIEAYKMVSELITKMCDGGTIYEAEGIYRHENGEIVVEKTLKVELMFCEDFVVRNFVDEVKKLLNQESVVVQKEEINSELW